MIVPAPGQDEDPLLSTSPLRPLINGSAPGGGGSFGGRARAALARLLGRGGSAAADAAAQQQPQQLRRDSASQHAAGSSHHSSSTHEGTHKGTHAYPGTPATHAHPGTQGDANSESLSEVLSRRLADCEDVLRRLAEARTLVLCFCVVLFCCVSALCFRFATRPAAPTHTCVLPFSSAVHTHASNLSTHTPTHTPTHPYPQGKEPLLSTAGGSGSGSSSASAAEREESHMRAEQLAALPFELRALEARGGYDRDMIEI